MPSAFTFPPFPREIFLRLSDSAHPEKFLLKNRSRGIAEMGIGICRAQNPAGKTFYLQTFDSAQSASLSPKWEIALRGENCFVTRRLDDGEACDAEAIRAEFDALLAEADSHADELVPPISQPQEVGGTWYLPAAQQLIREINAGTLQKIVLARSIHAHANSPIPVAPILGKLHERFEKNCSIFAVTRQGKTFMGASPETLVSLRDGVLETEALAGSIPNFPGADVSALAEQLLNDDKERREHQAVIDFILQQLRTLGIVAEFPATPEIVVLPNILHLRTPIRARLAAPKHILEIVSALHPTPAMCGTPASVAREKILATEPFQRGNYAGPLGFYDDRGEGFFAVGIRCAEISGCDIRLFAGSGLVAGSVPEREFAEIDSKFAAVLAHIQQKPENVNTR